MGLVPDPRAILLVADLAGQIGGHHLEIADGPLERSNLTGLLGDLEAAQHEAPVDRALAGLDTQQALESVLGKLKDTSSNVEFLMLMSKSNIGGKDN